MGNEPNGICGIVTEGGGVWAVVKLDGVKLKTGGGGVDDEEAEAEGGADEGGGMTPAGGTWPKMK